MYSSRSLSIRTTLNLLVLVCIFPVILIAIAVITYDYHREREQLVQNTVETSRLITGLVDQVFSGIETSLTTLSTSSVVWDPDHSKLYDQAQQLLRNQVGRNIILTDVQGKQLLNTLVPYGTSLMQYSNKVQSSKLSSTHAPVVSDLFRSAINGEQIVTVAIPLIRNNIHYYNLHTRISPAVLINLLAAQDFNPEWIVAIIDSSGTTVARSKDNDRFVGKKTSPDVLNALLTQPEGSIATNALDGTPIIASFSQSQITGWTAAIGIPVSLLTKDLHKRLLTVAIVSVVMLVTGLGLAWLLAAKIIAANRGLVAPALALGEGNLIHVPRFGLKEADEVGSALEKAAEKLSISQYKANHDSLTTLPNRTLFYEVVAKQLLLASSNKSPLSLLFIDLDGFKKINDQYGHAIGDEILRCVASRLSSILRQSDTPSRLGGDEFSVALPNTSLECAEIVAKKIIDGLSAPYKIDSRCLHISASIGIAISDNNTVTVETLIRTADDAMYIAKAAGKARTHVGVLAT